ncbi:MAG TPA: hypothetical protein VLT82_01945 [Myxococcaceae bacterium]|nr:hypothetical protein [Myxococcaceae bacterium]
MAPFRDIRWLLVAIGCSPLFAGCASTGAKLDLLRTRYLEAHRGELQRDLDPELQDLTFLVGMSSSTVQSALGPPERCRDPRSLQDRRLSLAECLQYPFELVGVGPEFGPGTGPAYWLQLRLDRGGNCTEPRWLVRVL